MNQKIKVEAFMRWLIHIGYRGVAYSSGDIVFRCHVSGKLFPKGVTILSNGRLNKPAKQLFKEFEGYLA